MRIAKSTRPIVFPFLGLLSLTFAGSTSSNGSSRGIRMLAARPCVVAPLAGADSDTTLESVLPSDGLQLYFEVRGEGSSQLAKLAAVAASQRDAGQPVALSIKDLSGFALTHMTALARARIALVTYAGSGFAIAIETASPEEGKRIAEDLTQALKRSQSKSVNPSKPGVSDQEQGALQAGQAGLERKIGSAVRGRVAIVGAQGAVDGITSSGAPAKLADDGEFLKSKSRFDGDPFFGYLATGLPDMPAPPAGEPARDYMAGLKFAQRTMPRHFVFGGSIAGDMATFHGLIAKPDGKSGLPSSVLSVVKSGEPTAAALVSKDTDVFVDVTIDWDKLYQAAAPLIGMLSGAAGPSDGADVGAALEQKLGFSIKDDLLPTLGGELAIAVHFPAGPVLQGKPAETAPGTKPPSPAFYVILALKDKAGFEALIGKLAGIGGSPPGRAAAVTTVQYRGIAIKSIKGFSYAIMDGFFIACGGQANLKKFLDERALGSSLASKAEYQAMIGAPGLSLFQVYLSDSASSRWLQNLKGGGSGKPAPLGFVMSEVPGGVALNLRMPVTLVASALSSAMNSSGGVFGIGPSLESAGESNRTVNGKPVPSMTSDELPKRP